jgi:transglutaminase-like putative cysteine protease
MLTPRWNILLALAAIFAFSSLAIAGDDWKPVDPAELALKSPVVDKDADAEALFWDVRVLDEVEGDTPRTVLNHYVRIKVFTDRGKESESQIKLFFLGNTKIRDIAGRTIRADGTILNLKKEDVFEKTEVKSSGLKIKAKSFAMPGVEPGSIIEYKWREERNDQLANYIRLQLQMDVPVQIVQYHIKPLSLPGFEYGMRLKTFNIDLTPFTKERDGFYATTFHNIPAFKEETRMPPEDQVRPWMLVYYSKDDKVDAAAFWKKYGKEVYEKSKSSFKVSDEVRTATAKAVGDATNPEDKLSRIFVFCRDNIKNVNSSASGLSAEEREKAKSNKSPSDTLKRGMGTGRDIDTLFAAMTIAAGFEARMVQLADRSDVFFDPSFPDDYFLQTYDIAVKIGDQWRFFDPASTYVPTGMLRWQEEGENALLSDPKEPTFVMTPVSGPEKSMEKRVAKLKLEEDGTLEGDVKIEYTGHFAVEKKNYNDQDSEVQREQTLTDAVKAKMSTAEISKINIQNVTDPVKPFVYEYHVRVPGYAQRTGKRLFLQPAFFQHGIGPLFAASARVHHIYFHYPWSESDDITIDLPAGYQLDSADAPAPFKAQDVSAYQVAISASKDGRVIHYRRAFSFGEKGNIVFPKGSYTQLKAFFDEINKRDNHTLTLKQGAASTANVNQ